MHALARLLLSITMPMLLLLQVEELRGQGQEPYAYRFDRTHFTTELQVAVAAVAQ